MSLNMNNLSSEITQGIFSFLDAETLPETRLISKETLNSVSSNEEWWKNELKTYSKKRLIKCKSSMITTLTIKQYRNDDEYCYNCGETGHNNCYHEIYNVMLCKQCIETPFYRLKALKKTCKEYFVDPNLTSEIIKTHGTNKKVLEKDIIKIAEDLYTPSILSEKLDKRENGKRRRLETRNIAVPNRMQELQSLYTREVTTIPSRVFDHLFEFSEIVALARIHNIFYYIIGDILRNKVNVHTDVKVAAKRFVDLACLLTFMVKRGLLCDNYMVNIEYKDFTVYSIMSKHLHGREHFYETVSDIQNSRLQFKERCDRMEKYLMENKNMNSSERKRLCVICCVEDVIDFDYGDFSEFISSGIGNPVKISRDKRISIFLNKNGYQIRYHECMQVGYRAELCDTKARNFAMRFGMEIMNSVCSVELS